MVITTVESTTLATVAYDGSSRLLRLEFKSRTVYCYSGVPTEVHHGLIAAPSKGAYFNRNIRGRFPYHRQECGGYPPSALGRP
jgi:hypothetical protein